MNTKLISLAAGAVLGLGLAGSVAAVPYSQCPTVGAATSCAVLYTFNADGSVSTSVDPSISSTDGVEDTLAGVQNNSGHVINSITLSGTGINGLGIFDFEGDGMSSIPNPGSGPGLTYFGQYFDSDGGLLGTTTFSGITTVSASNDTGTVDFVGLTDGGSGWFVLEDQISFTAPPCANGNCNNNVPEPASLALMALGLLGMIALRRRQG